MINVLSVPTKDKVELFLVEVNKEDDAKNALSVSSGLTVTKLHASYFDEYCVISIGDIKEDLDKWREYIWERHINFDDKRGAVLIKRTDDVDITWGEYEMLMNMADKL